MFYKETQSAPCNLGSKLLRCVVMIPTSNCATYVRAQAKKLAEKNRPLEGGEDKLKFASTQEAFIYLDVSMIFFLFVFNCTSCIQNGNSPEYWNFVTAVFDI